MNNFIHISSDSDLNEIPECYGIIFEDNFNKPINNLPNFIKEIHLNFFFNQSLDFLPFNLKKLVIKGEFNQAINNLPINLEELIIEGDFNQELTNLPDNLKYLELKGYFNKKIILPNNIETLIFGNFFDQPFNIPSSLKYLEFGRFFNQTAEYLPNDLVLSCNIDSVLLNYLQTDNLKKIYLKKYQHPGDFFKLDLTITKKIQCDIELLVGDDI